MAGASASAKDLALAGDVTAGKINQFSQAQKSAIAQTSLFKRALTSLKTVAASVGVMLAQMAIAFVVAEGINLLIKGVDALVVTSAEAIEKANEFKDAWNETDKTLSNTKKTLDSIGDEYAKLSKGVDSFGKNISLNADEFARYHEVTNQIADLFPDLVSGWDLQDNAILSTRGSVEDLTKAYDDLIIKQKEAILEGASTVFSGYVADAKNPSKWAWSGDPGYMLEMEYIDKVIAMREAGNATGAAEYSFDNAKVAKTVGDGLRDAGYADVSSMTDQEYLKALSTYRNILIKEANEDVREFQRIADAYLYLSDAYQSFEDSTKTGIQSIINSFDYDFISGFNDERELYAWIEDNLLTPLRDFDFSGIIDAKSLFDVNEMSVGDYSRTLSTFLKSIKGFAPEIQAALVETFTPDIQPLLKKVQEMLVDEYDEAVYSLTLGDLQLASNMSIPEGTLLSWSALIARINEAKTLAAASTDSLATEIESLNKEYSTIATAIGEQAKLGYVTYETYKNLISANSQYAQSFSVIDGQLRLNEKSAYSLADANAELAVSEAEAAQAIKEKEYDKNAKQLEEYNKQIEELEKSDAFDSVYDGLVSQRDLLESSQSVLEGELQTYRAITGEIRNMTSAYSDYLRAQETPDQGEGFDTFTAAGKAVKDGLKSGKTGTDQFQSAVDLILGELPEGTLLTDEEKQKRYKDALKLYERYFTGDDDPTGANHFANALVKAGLFTKGKGNSFTFGDELTADQIAETLGISLDAVRAMFGELEEYGWTVEWEKLFPTSTEVSTVADEMEEVFDEPKSEIEQAADEIIEDAQSFADAATEAAEIIAEGQKTVSDALAGHGVEDTPSSKEKSGGVSLFTAGESNERPNVSKQIPLEETITVFVNVETGEPISASMLLLNVTENEDGTLSYDVAANASAKDTVGANDLVLNAVQNSDGTYSYTVGVYGSPEGQVTKNSIIIGTDSDGSYRVGVYGQAQNYITKQGLVLGLNNKGQWTVIANGVAGDTVNKDSLVTGENPVVMIVADIADALTQVGVLDAAAGKKVTKEVEIKHIMPEVYDEPLMPEVYDEPIQEEVIDVPIRPVVEEVEMEEVHDQLIDEMEEVEDQLLPLEVPADINPKALSLKIAQFGDNLSDLIINVDGDIEDGEKKALELKRYIETLRPEMKVTVNSVTRQAYASGTKKAKPGVALTGEVEPELIEHRQEGTWSYVEEPTLVNLAAGDVVHSGDDTKKILRRSSGLSPSGRAFAGGGSLPLPTSTTASKSSKSAKKSSTSWSKYFEQLFDWIEIRLDRLSAITDRWTKQIANAIGFISKNDTVESAIVAIQDEINALQIASSKYMAQANAVVKKTGLKSGIIQRIQNGTLDIALYDDKTQKKISEYQKWYEKVLDTQDAVIDLEEKQRELANQKLDNISKEYDNLRGVIDNTTSAAESAIDLLTAQGKEVKDSNYTALLDAQAQTIKNLRDEQAALTKEFNEQLKRGTIVNGSQAWYDYKSAIDELDTTINQAQVDLIELNDTVNELTLTKLGYQLAEISEQEAAIQRQLDLIEAQGGTATDDLYRKLIAIGYNQVEILNAQNTALSDQLAGLDPMSEKYQEIAEQIRSNNDAINDAMSSQEQWNDAILDLKIDELNKAKDALSANNDEYQRQIDLQKAIEDLERAKSQRQIRILKDGKFQYVADTKAIGDAQRNLDEKLHDETMSKFDKAIELLEEQKRTDNVYETLGLTPYSASDILSRVGVDNFINSIAGSVDLAATFADLMSRNSTTSITPLQTLVGGSTTVDFAPGSIVINAAGSNANDIFNVFQNKLSTSLEQVLYRK